MGRSGYRVLRARRRTRPPGAGPSDGARHRVRLRGEINGLHSAGAAAGQRSEQGGLHAVPEKATKEFQQQ